ncbi:MAG: glycosyltransferase [Caulobacter sp.]|nr:glycosyltransferase [Caulobacter sp.]
MAVQMTLSEALGLAVERQERLELEQAEAICRQILNAVPDWRPAAGLLVSLLLSTGRPDEAARIAARYPRLDDELTPGDMVENWRRHSQPAGVVGTVIVPAFRAAGCIARALDSVARAVDHLRAAVDDPGLRVLLVVSDDACPKGSAAAALDWARARDWNDLRLAAVAVNRGAAVARNTGARLAEGPLLWFLDADDEFLPEHLHITRDLLLHTPRAGFVRTGMVFETIDDQVTLTARIRNQNTSPINLCVRRACHDFVGGFPEEPCFRDGGGEDVAYADFLSTFFYGIRKMRQTVVYRRRPGNSLDVQADEFTGRVPSDQKVLPRDLLSRQIAARVFTMSRLHRLRHVVPPDGLPPLRGVRWPVENVNSDPEYG